VRCTASVVAGDVLELTRDVKLALDWIGKWISGWRVATCARAIRGSKRPPQLWTDCWARSATETVTQTVTESWEPWEGDLEPSEQLELIELGREDSNLQLPKSRGRRAQHRPKQDKHLTDASNEGGARVEPNIDPETVTKPSSGSAASDGS
jgi:hypothetical protein